MRSSNRDAHRDEQVAPVDGVVRRFRPVHAEHPEELGLGPGECPEPHQGQRHRDPGGLDEPGELLRCVGRDDPAPGVEEGSLRLRDRLHRLLDLPRVPLHRGVVPRYAHLVGVLELDFGGEDVLRQVDENRPRPPRRRDEEGLLHHLGELLRVLHDVVVLRDRARDPRDVRLLEGVVSYDRCRDLPREGDHGDRIHVGRREPRDDVRRARAARDEDDAGLSRAARVAVGRVDGPLLVFRHDETDRLVPVKGIEEGDDHTSRDAEYGGHFLPVEYLDDCLCTGQLHV